MLGGVIVVAIDAHPREKGQSTANIPSQVFSVHAGHVDVGNSGQ